MRDLYEEMRQCLQGRICLMGLGNVACSDDGLGVRVAAALEERLGSRPAGTCAVVSAGVAPERFIGPDAAACFDCVLFVDAVDFGGAPGAVLLMSGDELTARFPQVSTHRLSIALLARALSGNGRTTVHLLGVQPGSLRPGAVLSPVVERTVESLVELLCPLLGPAPPQAARMEGEGL